MRRDVVILGEAVEAAERIVALVAGLSVAALESDELRRDALLWNYTVLGEAAGQLSPELLSAHPGVDWRKPVQLRNRIVHGYWSVDLEILVTTAQDDLPDFVRAVRPVIAKLASEP